MNVWTVETGLEIIRLIYPASFKAGYNLHLGGSVMYRGDSVNDLDIIAVRRANVLTCDCCKVVDALIDLGYGVDSINNNIPYRALYRLRKPGPERGGEKIDLICIDLLGDLPAQTETFDFGMSGEDNSGRLTKEESEQKSFILYKNIVLHAKLTREKIRREMSPTLNPWEVPSEL